MAETYSPDNTSKAAGAILDILPVIVTALC
jgi:hypothetical protein